MVNADKHRQKRKQQLNNMFRVVKRVDTMEAKVHKNDKLLNSNMNLAKYCLSRNYKEGI